MILDKPPVHSNSGAADCQKTKNTDRQKNGGSLELGVGITGSVKFVRKG